MAARLGEDLAATLFADIHYFYGPPAAKPPHHRFDKGSYVYLFENPSQRRARVEVANNAGTTEQDAFDGHLDGAHVQYSYRHSTLVTVTVDARVGQQNIPPNSQEWHLPTFDPSNEKKYMYKLHTVDIYFWTKEDAIVFVNGVRRVLPPYQISVQDEPVSPPPHQEAMSPVVQKLENVAITDPSYQQGRTRDSRTTSAFAGPPTAATPQSQISSSTPTFSGPPAAIATASQESSAFAPMAYNPAAPAAPEAIKHREKTPPPEDGAANPLVAAAASEQGQSFGAPYQQHGVSGSPQAPAQQGYFSGRSVGMTGSPGAVPGPPGAPPLFCQPPPSAGLQSPFAQHFQNSFAGPPSAPISGSPYSQPPVTAPPPPAYQQQAPPQAPVTQYANFPGSPGMHPGVTNPGIYSPGFESPMAAPTAQSVPCPPGGFAQYNYNNKVSNTQPLSTDYSIHQQVYRPAENEAYKHTKDPKPPRGRLEARAGQLEKGVGSLFKKLEKRIG